MPGQSISSVEIDGSRPNKRPTMSDSNKENDCDGMKRMKVNDAEGLGNRFSNAENLLATCENQAETKPSTFPSPAQPLVNGIESPGAGSAFEQGAASTTLMIKEGGSEAVYSQRYKATMNALSKHVSSYALLYEPYVAKGPKTPPKKETRKSTKESVLKSRTEKTPTKKEAKYISFPQNVRTLTASGMLDGVGVRYLSSSRQKALRGIIKGTSYLCGCTSCNFSKEVTALEFESHSDSKTSHPNNHIHLENGMSLHQVVQELKNTSPSMLCDAIHAVIGPSLNREAFSSWKESFEAASEKWNKLYESNIHESPIHMQP